MSDNFDWQLPLLFRSQEVLSKISWDGQVYFACQQCFWEVRSDPTFASDLENTLDDVVCTQCGAHGIHLIRHLEHREYHCEDCGRGFEVETAGFETIQCPQCMSMHLSLLSNQILPPFTPRFGQGPGLNEAVLPPESRLPAGQVLEPHIWGVSALQDLDAIEEENYWYSTRPDFPLYLLWIARFSRRLRLYGGYEDKKDYIGILNIEAGYLNEYFRRTGELSAGLEALALYEENVRITDEPFQRALNEHNVAMAIFSLLNQHSEDEISILTSRPNLRMEGVAAAERALSVFEQGPRRDTEGSRKQCAHIHHVLGDLLSIGNADDGQRKQAVDHLATALQSNALPPYLVGAARNSRAAAILGMSDPTPALRAQAIEDLEWVISRDESDRLQSSKWVSLSNLANLYIEENEPHKALPLLEHAAALALNEITLITDEVGLQQKSDIYVEVFDTLARIYIMIGKAEQALNAVETLRAATIRLHTMSDAERKKRQVAADKVLTSEAVSEGIRLLGGEAPPPHTRVSKLRLQSIDSYVKKLMRYLKDDRTAFVTFIVWVDAVVAIVVAPQKPSQYKIHAIEWQTRPVDMILPMVTSSDPSPLREARLQQLCQLGHEILLASLIPLLHELGITRIAISAPGILSHFPFEIISLTHKLPDAVNDVLEVFYLPSLSLGADLIKSVARHGSSRLLVVGYQGSDLPHTRDEIQALRDLWKDQMTLLEGDACTKRRVLNELRGDYGYIHFTCHGTFDLESPLDSALHLVPKVERDSQRVTARDILELRFQHAPVVTLSACSSALTSYSATNDCTGLTGSFLRSGARCVIGSRWPVYDDVSAFFMSQLYNKMRKTEASPQRCLYEVQHQMAKSAGIEDWAAFGYLGLP